MSIAFLFYLVMRKIVIVSFFLLFLGNQWLVAQQAVDSTFIQLSDVEVNARRVKLYSEMGRVLTVINKSEIARSAVQSIDQLLDYVAGVDIRQRGTNATQADISIRGGSFDQVLVLLNGVNITDPQTGHFNLDIPLNLSDVSRVEILQGSAARVLGSNAFSGAINLVTTTANASSGLDIRATLEAGSYSTSGQSIATTASAGRFHTFGSVSHKSSQGYLPNTDYDYTNAFIQSDLNSSVAGKFGIQLAAQQKSFGANSFYSLAYPNQFEASKTFLAALNWSLTKADFSFNAQAYWRRHHDRFELFRDFAGSPAWYKFHNYHLTDVVGGKASANYISGIGKTTLGIDFRNEHIFSNVLGTTIDSLKAPLEKNGYFTKEGNRLVSTVFIDHALTIDKWYFSVGVAATHSDAFGLNGYYGADIAYVLNDYARVFVNANSAVRLPTYTDLYYKSATQVANPDLQPERSQTFELGTKVNDSAWKLEAIAYYRLGQDVIDWVKLPAEASWYSKNLTNVNALGADISAQHHFEKLFIQRIGVAYSFLQMNKDASTLDSKYVLDYLKNKFVFSVDHTIVSKLTASWKFGYFDRAGTYTDVNKKLQNYTPYSMLDGRLLWNDSCFDIFADVNNILNVQYADYGGLNQPGLNFNVGIRVKIL